MPFYLNLKRNGSLHWPSSRSLPSLLPFFLSFFPSFLFLYSFTPPLLPSLSHPVHPLPPIAFLSYRKSKRLTCKWGLLNPNRPSVTSQQRQGGWGGRGEGGNYDLREGQSERDKLRKRRLGGKKVVKEMLSSMPSPD